MTTSDLESEYFDPVKAGSYAGRDQLYRAQKKRSRREVNQWLRGQETYTLFRPARRRLKTPAVLTSGIDHQWDSDLLVWDKYAKWNNGFKYILVCIDILSHFIFTRPLKTKKPEEVGEAMLDIFTSNRRPYKLRHDRGLEYLGKVFIKTMKDAGVHSFPTNTLQKANYAERTILNIKRRLHRYMYQNKTRKWVDVLQKVTTAINHSYHRTIKMRPVDVTEENQAEVWLTQYAGKEPEKPAGPFKFDLNQYVRVSHIKRTFSRGYEQNWSSELFKIVDRRVRGGYNIYQLEDYSGESVLGVFWEGELQDVTFDPQGIFRVDKILRKRKRQGHVEHLVAWTGWPSRYNSWVRASDMV